MCSRYKPAEEDELLKALQVIDLDSKGYLTSEELMQFIRVEGRIFFLLHSEFGFFCIL